MKLTIKQVCEDLKKRNISRYRADDMFADIAERGTDALRIKILKNICEIRKEAEMQNEIADDMTQQSIPEFDQTFKVLAKLGTDAMRWIILEHASPPSAAEVIAQYGSDEHRDMVLDILAREKYHYSIPFAYLAKYGNDKHRERVIQLLETHSLLTQNQIDWMFTNLLDFSNDKLRKRVVDVRKKITEDRKAAWEESLK